MTAGQRHILASTNARSHYPFAALTANRGLLADPLLICDETDVRTRQEQDAAECGFKAFVLQNGGKDTDRIRALYVKKTKGLTHRRWLCRSISTALEAGCPLLHSLNFNAMSSVLTSLAFVSEARKSGGAELFALGLARLRLVASTTFKYGPVPKVRPVDGREFTLIPTVQLKSVLRLQCPWSCRTQPRRYAHLAHQP